MFEIKAWNDSAAKWYGPFEIIEVRRDFLRFSKKNGYDVLFAWRKKRPEGGWLFDDGFEAEIFNILETPVTIGLILEGEKLQEVRSSQPAEVFVYDHANFKSTPAWYDDGYDEWVAKNPNCASREEMLDDLARIEALPEEIL